MIQLDLQVYFLLMVQVLPLVSKTCHFLSVGHKQFIAARITLVSTPTLQPVPGSNADLSHVLSLSGDFRYGREHIHAMVTLGGDSSSHPGSICVLEGFGGGMLK